MRRTGLGCGRGRLFRLQSRVQKGVCGGGRGIGKGVCARVDVWGFRRLIGGRRRRRKAAFPLRRCAGLQLGCLQKRPLLNLRRLAITVRYMKVLGEQ